MDNVITENEAYELYLKSGLEDVMPFRDWSQHDYIGYLYDRGVVVLDCEEVQDL